MAIKWNKELQFPTDSCFANRILSAEYGPSSKGNLMITMETEIVVPDEYSIGQQMVEIAGIKVTSYFTANNDQNKDKIVTMFKNLGLSTENMNWDNLDVEPLKGLVILTAMRGRQQPKTKSPTATQMAEAAKTGARPVGDPMINPVTKKQMIEYWPEITDIFGLAPADVAASKPY